MIPHIFLAPGETLTIPKGQKVTIKKLYISSNNGSLMTANLNGSLIWGAFEMIEGPFTIVDNEDDATITLDNGAAGSTLILFGVTYE